MKSTAILGLMLGAMAAWGQIPSPPGLKTGPGVQAPNDSKEPDVLKTCKVPPQARGGGPRRGAGPAAAAPGPKEYTVSEIPGVIAAGQKWKEIWEVDGNNADGIIATKDGGVLLGQNGKRPVIKL